MRVLWLTFTAAGASKIVNSNVAGCGWIASLEDCIKVVPGITLGIGFFHNCEEFKFNANGIHYYPINMKYNSIIGKIKQRLFSQLYDTNTKGIQAVIKDFNPDLIHLFGTESGMAEVVHITSVPVIAHLQGLIGPYLSSWFPKGISQYNILLNSPIRPILFRRGYYFMYKLFKKRAVRETKAIKELKYFFGRTDWDKHYLELIKDKFEYFHCEEVLRPIFYDYVWEQPDESSFRIVTVINAEIYKGLEIVLEVGNILKNIVKMDFQWCIIGVSEQSELSKIIQRTTRMSFNENNIILKGPKIGKELIDELLKANAFIHPSHIDNSPNSVCEAMLLGMPIIAANVGGISSLLSNNNEGILYNSFDSYELASIIQRYSHLKDHLKVMGARARIRAQKRHSLQEITSTVIKAYEKVINKNCVQIKNRIIIL